MWNTYYSPGTLEDALVLLAQHGAEARIIAGATDLLLEMERGIRSPKILIDITRVPGLDTVQLRGGVFRLGPLVTHNQVVADPLLAAHAYPLARACWEVGAPQIRNRGTVAGNLLTASPANDTIAPLRAMDASVTLRSASGEKTLSFQDFFRGVRRTAMEPHEMLVEISFPALPPTSRATFLKLGLRRSQAISVVNVAAVIDFDAPGSSPPVGPARAPVRAARIALGSVAPTIVRAAAAEACLAGKILDDETIAQAAQAAAGAARPISDVRGPASYRAEVVQVLVARALRQLRDGSERSDWPLHPILLQGAAREAVPAGHRWAAVVHAMGSAETIETTVNGRRHAVRDAAGKTLLHMLREDLGLTGTKEGCGEGECGACTVFLDGIAVMACLVPAPRAHGAQVVTIEGLADDSRLHPVQQSFIRHDAIQCGYCTPGFIMAGAKLLEEEQHPSRQQVIQGISGNLCRCTGYANIVRAIEHAAELSETGQILGS